METPQDTGEICTGILAGFDDCRLFGIVDAVIDYSSSFWNSLNFSRARVLTNLAFLIVDVGSTVEAFETLSAGGVASGIALFFPPAEVATCSVTAIGAIECVGAIVLSVNDIAKIDKSYGEFSHKLENNRYSGDLLSRSKSDFKHLGVKQIEKRFGLEKGSYHPSGADGIKKEIMADLFSKFPKDMKKLGDNCDLAFANDGQIMVISTRTKGKSFVSDLNILNYK